jgi:uncharacterized membrane-anchored protein
MRLPNYRLGVLLAFLVQAGLLGWMVADRALLLMNDNEIRLAVVPVDPRDLFRGDYVILSYEISQLNNTQLTGDDEFERGDAIYVTLADGGAGLKATEISHAAPANGTFIRGTVTNLDDQGACTGVSGCWIYSATYNLEKFFVPEGTGREIETLRNDQKVSVDVAVASDGRAALKRLLVDGQVRYDEPTL